MKKVKFIYNPYSGENTILGQLDTVIRVHQNYNLEVVPFRISRGSDLEKAFDYIDDSYKYILVAGGDGTVDSVVNIMKKIKINLPLGILPTGTANDFGKFIGMPHDIEKAIIQILESEIQEVDIGKINDKYFINVASTGLFTDISQKTDDNLKNAIGKLAYYVKGIEQIPNFRKLKVKVESTEESFEGHMYLMLVFNGATAGNLDLAYKSNISDGMLDVIIIKADVIKDIIPFFIKMIRKEHLEYDKGVVYFKTDKLCIDCHENIVTDIDGEKGPEFPLVIECDKKGLRLLGVKNVEVRRHI
jgi:YegS/Rv2252/BmrU family lipid kinase